ncbi:MAG: hypothetical protein JRI23_35420, partial [Deltaproteobacteria bacterium]|nr:hypothetical protein [Deltaproteobacteria bacterium]MBW2537620.1 hypothetical protein [Deltaproteobacteria bacterium]
MTTTPDDLASFPEAAADDPEEVRSALEIGQAMWSQGNREDALRWLKRAAETASEEGADMRAVALAKAAADRRSMLGQPEAAAAPAPAAGPSGP